VHKTLKVSSSGLPEEIDRRSFWLFVVLILLSLLSPVSMSKVFWTIFLAGVFAYVLYPVKERLGGGRISDRVAAGLVTLSAFGFVVAYSPYCSGGEEFT